MVIGVVAVFALFWIMRDEIRDRVK
jgi:hypothetical protein